MKNTIMRTALLFLLALTTFSYTSAQVIEPNPSDSWKKRLKAGDKLASEGDFSSATAHYISVLLEKPKKSDIAYKAGETAFKARRYQDVVMALEGIKEEAKKFPKARFYYAMGLKGIGNYADAAQEFDAFSDAYRGADYQNMSDWATREMQGCALGQEQVESDNIRLSYVSKMVNSPRKEFAPIPFGADILYFSSDNKIATKIYRTEKEDRTWKEPQEPAIFGAMEREHFCGGSFTPNKMRFYFSQCEIIDGEYRCEIYVMQRGPGSWSKPNKLPNYINSEGYTAMDPFVTVENGKEILYFTSDREGSYGGKDIWYATKNYNTDDLNFDIPVNLGESVNTAQDEMSPFYVNSTRTLYFSSNGQANIGGFDIFKVKGALENWTQSENLGLPLNSSADDTYFILKEDLNSGFIASNRAFSGEKTSTDNDDLFMFTIKEDEVVLEGKIHEEGNTAQLVENVMVSIFEVTTDGEFALNSNITPDGYYQFIVQPNKGYQVRIEKRGYEASSFDINTTDYPGENTIIFDLPIANENNVVTNNSDIRIDVPGVSDVDIDNNATTGDNENEPPIPGSNPDDNEVTTIEEPVPGGNRDNLKTKIPGGEQPTTRPERVTIPPVEEKPIEEEKPTTIDPKDNFENNDNDNTNPDVIEIPVEEPSQAAFEFPNSSNTIGEKHISELTQRQIDDIQIYDGKPYLKVSNGFLAIDNKPRKVEGFEGVEEGIGTHYRIQLAAVSNYRPYKFETATEDGLKIVTESAVSREGSDVTRVMVVSFPNFSTAKQALRELRSKGYDRAFIIRYENNRRVGRMIRDID